MKAKADALNDIQAAQSANKYALVGKTILITRPKLQNETLANKIISFGGKVVKFPVIRIIPPRDTTELDHALEQLASFDWLIFTSINGVALFFARLDELKVDRRLIHSLRVAAVGPKTAMALVDQGLSVEVVPHKHYAEALIETLRPLIRPGDAILLPRANIARKLLVNELQDMGASVSDISVYETVMDAENAKQILSLLQQSQIDMITFTSSSTVDHLVLSLQKYHLDVKTLLQDVNLACIGPITATTLRSYGLKADIEAQESTIDGLVYAIIQFYKRNDGQAG